MIVLDASAWIDMLVGQAATIAASDLLVVPPHFKVETIATLRALTQRSVLTSDQARQRLEQHLRGAFAVERSDSDIWQAWEWRESMSFRDAWYAALAKRFDATWVTSDAGARSTAARLGIRAAAPEPRRED